ncbi:MAG: glycoside hydrolase family 127 protein, partial [Kiritimatiellae bacterium]|nr:glycoside hydrolase family 127 protein [Kiritimatiellia bacterium]
QPGNAGGDMWERKYVMLALERYYTEVNADGRVLESLKRQADAIISQIGDGEGKVPLVSLGWSANHIESATLLEPFMRLYDMTGEKRYLDFASYIMSTGGAAGYDLFGQARDATTLPKDIGGVYPKAYEMLSLFEGVVEYYRATGDEKALAAAKGLFGKVMEREITIIGNGGGDQPYTPQVAGEGWDDTAFEQTNPGMKRMMETCTGVTWLKFCSQLLRLDCDARIADAIENYAYNGLLGAMKPDGTGFSYVNLLNGEKVTNVGWGWNFDGKPVTCCNLNGPTGVAYLPTVAVMDSKNGPVVNLYEPLDAESDFAYLSISGAYPYGGVAEISVDDVKVGEFELRLRIPGWSEYVRVSLNGETLEGAKSGSYFGIRRRWRRGDAVRIEFDMRVKTVAAPKGSHPQSGDFTALRAGPVVLARDEKIDSGYADAVDIETNVFGFVDARRIKLDGYRLAYEIPVAGGKTIRMVDYASVDCWNGGHVETWLPKARVGTHGVTKGFRREMPRTTGEKPAEVSYERLLEGFVDPFGLVRTGCYWYWISGNISADGARKDIEAMAKAGIDRAHIGDIGDAGPAPGDVRTFSEEWYAAFDAAVKAAAKNGVELGVFNSPGWSQSGGPWIDHTRAMRRLAIYEPEMKEFEEIATVLYPRPRLDGKRLEFLAEGEKITPTPDGGFVREAAAERDFTAQSLELVLSEGKYAGHVTVEAEKDGGWIKAGEFDFSRKNPELNVGFLPYAPVTGTFPAVSAKRFRVTVAPHFGDGAWAFTSMALRSEPGIAYAAEKSLAKMYESPLPMWSDYMWPAEATEIPGTWLDATKATILKPGEKLPEGDYVSFRFGMVPTGTVNGPAVPEATGYEVDKMSAEHVAYHYAAYMKKLRDRIPAEYRHALKYSVLDSYEVGGQNMTDRFAERFMAKFGYDPTPYLPAFFGYDVEGRDISDRFLWDVRRFVADETAHSYVAGLRKASEADGVETWLECYGHWGFPGEFLQYGGQSDGIAGEFWSEGTLGDIENRAATSCAHIYGKNLVWSESNTSSSFGMAYRRGPMELKSRLDRFFAEGINATLLHLYIHQPDERIPGVNAWFGTEFNRHNSWFGHMDLYTGYLKRANWMLRQGLYVADIAYFIGEDTPKMTGAIDPACPRGRQFDYINAEVLVETADVDGNGRIVLPHGTSYEVLVLPRLDTMRPETLAAIGALAKKGAKVIGPRPKRSPSLANQPFADMKVAELAGELWGGGFVSDDVSLDDALAERGSAPDFVCDDNLDIDYCHRTLENGDIYFLSNQSGEATGEFEVSFRATGRIPEIWCAETLEHGEAPVWKFENGRTFVRLSLDRLQSAFVVMMKPAGERAAGRGVPEMATVAVDGKWKLEFEADPLHRGPDVPVAAKELFDLSASGDPAIRNYSGRITYTTSFTLPEAPSGKVVLSLGAVNETAKVKINGRSAGGVCFAPYMLDVSGLVKEGENELEVEVLTTWVNRLAGDAALPKSERPTYLALESVGADEPLKRSGLLGPVELLIRK